MAKVKHTRQFKIREKVVYPSHGVGVITGEETTEVAGHFLKLYVIDFEKEKMTLRVPMNRTHASGLRSLSDEKKIKKAIATLNGRPKQGRGMWSRRADEYNKKINSGEIILVAEVVRDLHKNVDDPERSYSERIIYEAALNRLAGEIAASRKISLDDIIHDLEEILRAKKQAAVNQNAKIVKIKQFDTDEFDNMVDASEEELIDEKVDQVAA